MKKLIGAAFVLLLALTITVACSEQSSTEERAATQQQGPSQAASEQQAAMTDDKQPAVETQSEQTAALDNEIQGTVVKTEDGIVIFSDKGSYVVAGQDLEGLVGKNVRVTGTIEEADGQSVVTVSSVSVIE